MTDFQTVNIADSQGSLLVSFPLSRALDASNITGIMGHPLNYAFYCAEQYLRAKFSHLCINTDSITITLIKTENNEKISKTIDLV
jgi:hypothetical protein